MFVFLSEQFEGFNLNFYVIIYQNIITWKKFGNFIKILEIQQEMEE